jgi:polyhydroxybutyrate depolymerase
MNISLLSTVLLPSFWACSGATDDLVGAKTGAPDTITLGLSSQNIDHEEETREYLLYVPESYDPAYDWPLMLNFHGFGGSAEEHLSWADMRSLADAERFILVYPQGTLLDGSSHWNAGLETEENKSVVDNFGFIDTLLDSLSSLYAIVSTRIYASGYSSGAFFAYSLACFSSDRIAAIGSVSGTMMEETYESCTPSHPTAMIKLHGTSDDTVPYSGTTGLSPINEVIEYWADNNNITDKPSFTSVHDNGTTIEHYTYSGGENETSIEHYKIIGGEHVWFDINYEGANTNQLIWDFVSQYDKNGRR